MRIGAPKEIKNHEYRVGLTPESVAELAGHGHEVLVETGAGLGIGADDTAYAEAGGSIVGSAEEVFSNAEMIVKVKEPQANERKMLRKGPDPLHLSAPRPGPRADQGPGRLGRHLHRL